MAGVFMPEKTYVTIGLNLGSPFIKFEVPFYYQGVGAQKTFVGYRQKFPSIGLDYFLTLI